MYDRLSFLGIEVHATSIGPVTQMQDRPDTRGRSA
jgi:hypothetical protein